MLLDCAITSFTGSQRMMLVVIVQLPAAVIECAVLAKNRRVQIDQAFVERAGQRDDLEDRTRLDRRR